MKSPSLRKLLNLYRRLKFFVKIQTSWLRPLPDFLIIGTQKGGTTSLYEMLIQHPSVMPAGRKEIHYFDNNFHNGPLWYRSFFPSILRRYKERRNGAEKLLTGEASPYYFLRPHVPERVYNLVPNAKIILLLRNPIDRAYSQYQHLLRIGRLDTSFEKALEIEKQIYDAEYQKIVDNPGNFSLDHITFSFCARGEYLNQLKRWLMVFPQEQVLIIQSEDFFDRPQLTGQAITQFLELPEYNFDFNGALNAGKYEPMKPETRKRLAKSFQPHNDALFEFLGKEFGWE